MHRQVPARISTQANCPKRDFDRRTLYELLPKVADDTKPIKPTKVDCALLALKSSGTLEIDRMTLVAWDVVTLRPNLCCKNWQISRELETVGRRGSLCWRESA